jgi:uncharacterized protein YpuA (DUF1002 family)
MENEETKDLIKNLLETIVEEKLEGELGNVFVKRHNMMEQIKKEVKAQKVELEKSEIRKIVEELMVNLPEVVSKEIKKHLLLLSGGLSKFMDKNFKKGG